MQRLLQSFKVSRIKDACFTASLFQGFITHNSSPNWGGARRAEGMSILISPLGRTIITYLACAQTIATYLGLRLERTIIQNS
jgi:hypothetical protein